MRKIYEDALVREVLMPDQEEIEQQQQLLAVHRRTLSTYIKRRALLGQAHIPPEVEHGIDDARQNIRRIKLLLESWGLDVESFPDDEEKQDAEVDSRISSVQSDSGQQFLDGIAKGMPFLRVRLPDILKRATFGDGDFSPFKFITLCIVLILIIGAIAQWFASEPRNMARAIVAWIASGLFLPIVITLIAAPEIKDSDKIPNVRAIHLAGAYLGFALTEVILSMIIIAFLSLFGENMITNNIVVVFPIVISISTITGLITAITQVDDAKRIITSHEGDKKLFSLPSLAVIYIGMAFLIFSPFFLLVLMGPFLSRILSAPGSVALAVALFFLLLLRSLNKKQ